MKSEGYKISAITVHNSLNAKKNCNELCIIKSLSYRNVVTLLKKIDPENSKKLILGSGIVETISSKNNFSKSQFLWNNPETIFKLNDPSYLFSKLSSLGIKIPSWQKNPPSKGNYLCKDIRSYGGLLVRKLKRPEGVIPNRYIYYQKYISGRNISVQFFSKSGKFRVLSTCLQWNYKTTEKTFLLGGIVAIKLKQILMRNIKNILKILIENFKLSGINSVDFIISRGKENIYLIDINPRPGLSSNILYKLKLNRNILNRSSQIIYSTKDRLFDEYSINMLHKIDPNIEFTEIPLAGTIIKKNQPICLVHRKVAKLKFLKTKYKEILKKINNI